MTHLPLDTNWCPDTEPTPLIGGGWVARGHRRTSRPDPFHYDEEDRKAIASVEAHLARKWPGPGVETVGNAVKGWAATVEEVVRGYGHTIYDYTKRRHQS